MDIDSDLDEFLGLIEEIVEDGGLERGSRDHGIAIKCAHDGFYALSDKQKACYLIKVQPLLKLKSCPLPGCGERVHLGFRLCPYHDYMRWKADRED